MPAFSVLDLCPVVSGESASVALNRAVALAQRTEALGFKRYWVAEHHSMAGIASASPEVIIGHIAQATQTIRVGSGGIMLPNHSPFRIAEAFRTLEAFHPHRIDLGLGRAPGTNTATSLTLRGGDSARLEADDFPVALDRLQAFLSSRFIPNHPYQDVVAMPTVTTQPEIWILGSSDYGARLAGARGLPFAFAQHFSPLDAAVILDLYRRSFKPSALLDRPHAMIALHVIAAESDAQAKAWAQPADVAMYRYRTTGKSAPLPTLAEANESPLTPHEQAQLRRMAFPKIVGSSQTVSAALHHLAERTQAEEFIITSMIPDAAAREASYERVSTMFR